MLKCTDSAVCVGFKNGPKGAGEIYSCSDVE